MRGKADMARAMQNARFMPAFAASPKAKSDVENGFEANAKLGLHK